MDTILVEHYENKETGTVARVVYTDTDGSIVPHIIMDFDGEAAEPQTLNDNPKAGYFNLTEAQQEARKFTDNLRMELIEETDQ